MIKAIIVLQLVFLALCSALVARNNNNLQDQFLVKNLPGLYDNIPKENLPLMFSGQLELYLENKTYYYFWKYVDQNKVDIAKGKTIFWLNGGPGCSSMDGALMEAGPFRINKKGEVTYNEGSWHKAADMIFVDQPAGTGFSYSQKYDSDLNGVVQHFLRFLDKYFEVFPEDLENDIYIAGESYAGQYIPYIGKGILDRNRAAQDGSGKLKFKGALIGNGWIAPNEQSLSYLPFAHQAGVVDEKNEDWNKLLHQQEICQGIVNQIKAGTLEKGVNANDIVNAKCEKILSMILTASLDRSADSDKQCINMYDSSLRDSYPSCGMNWPPDLSNVNPFLNDDNVLDMLNVKEHRKWRECSGGVGNHLKNANMAPSVTLLPAILEEIPIILFNGNRDIICNYMGTEDFIMNMEWNGAVGWGEAGEQESTDLRAAGKYKNLGFASDWIYDNEHVGYIKQARNLTFVNVFGASHMVPFDKPFVSRSIIDLILEEYDESVSDDGKRIFVTYPLGTKPKNIPIDDIPSSATELTSTSTSPVSQSTSSAAVTSSSVPTTSDISSTTSRITRLIQLVVICILIWGIYVIYGSYKSRPSSIIKTGPSSGKKKNVQWADQLRLFQDADTSLDNSEVGVAVDQKGSFLSKAYNKLTGGNGERSGQYVAAPLQDIELAAVDGNANDFEIHTDEEDEEPRASQHETNERV